VLASGSGTNLQALIDAADPEVNLCLVISDREDAAVLSRATVANIPTELIRYGDFQGRDEFSEAIVTATRHVDALVLAGFMRILSPVAIEHFPERILNIHPSLLPAFPGAHAVAQALAHGVKLTGVTVHFVDAEVDHGPIIAQRSVSVEPGDDEADLHRRIQAVEHDLYPAVVSAFARGKIKVSGREVIWQ
jgi:phosphoribosylglycinamide formyltransferase 1